MRVSLARTFALLTTLIFPAGRVPSSSQPGLTFALTGATIIDGRGGNPLANGTILFEGGRIATVGPAGAVRVPPGTRALDLRGRFIIPGFVNANAHLTPYFALGDFAGPESLLVRGALEGMQVMLRRGITTIRDTYGALPVLLAARELSGTDPGSYPRLLAAGNILGWGGPWSYTFGGSGNDRPANPFQRRYREAIVQGMGEELIGLSPDSLRVMLRHYLAREPDFIKLGVTTHLARPALFLFTPAGLQALVSEAHRAGKRVDAHAESVEGLRLAVEAGVDVLQHPETAGGDRIPIDLLAAIRGHRIVCSMVSAEITGQAWEAFTAHLALGGRMWPAEGPPSYMVKIADSLRKAGIDPQTRPRAPSVGWFRNHRANAEGLIRSGCPIAVATDDVVPLPGTGTGQFGTAFARAVAGLVELGMTPMQALVAATRNGAIAANLDRQIGTIAPGKVADLLVLSADPLADIHNIEKLDLVIRAGHLLK